VSDIALDAATGDIELIAGRARLAKAAEATAQLWATHLTLFLGEWAFDQNLGIDYQNEILIKNPRFPVVRSIFAKATRETPGIAQIERLAFRLGVDRKLDVEADVVYDDSSTGTLSLSEQVGGA
jgi:hypothetical protein